MGGEEERGKGKVRQERVCFGQEPFAMAFISVSKEFREHFLNFHYTLKIVNKFGG